MVMNYETGEILCSVSSPSYDPIRSPDMSVDGLFINRVTGKSANYFMAQQDSLAKLNGFVEEMVNGQKVIKVFNHEDQSVKDFQKLNDTWRTNAGLANGHANSVAIRFGETV